MNCREFSDRIHEYLDETLEPGLQAAAREHVAHCPECRLALQRVQSFGRAVQYALQQAAAPISLEPELRRKVLAAAESVPVVAPAGFLVWQRLFGSSFRILAAGAALFLVVMLIRPFRRPPPAEGSTALPRIDRGSYMVDVPQPIETHIFQVQNGSVIDAVVTHVAVSRAQFFSASKIPSPSP